MQYTQASPSHSLAPQNMGFLHIGRIAPGNNGWNPGTLVPIFTITGVPRNLDNSDPAICSAYNVKSGSFSVAYNGRPSSGAFLDYLIISCCILAQIGYNINYLHGLHFTA